MQSNYVPLINEKYFILNFVYVFFQGKMIIIFFLIIL